MSRWIASGLSLLILICGGVLASGKTYPEKGTVLSMRIAEKTITGHGSSVTMKSPVYRVETETKFYELEASRKERLKVGETLEFRVQADWAYVQRGNSEEKYRIVGVELKQHIASV